MNREVAFMNFVAETGISPDGKTGKEEIVILDEVNSSQYAVL